MFFCVFLSCFIMLQCCFFNPKKSASEKYTTKVSIENRLNECNPPWESYFVKYINEKNNKVTLKEKRLRGNKY